MFKPGDKVRCIDNKGVESILELGKSYTIWNGGVYYPSLCMNIKGVNGYFCTSRFELITEKQETKKQEASMVEHKFKIGDKIKYSSTGINRKFQQGAVYTVDRYDNEFPTLLYTVEYPVYYTSESNFTLIEEQESGMTRREALIDQANIGLRAIDTLLGYYPEECQIRSVHNKDSWRDLTSGGAITLCTTLGPRMVRLKPKPKKEFPLKKLCNWPIAVDDNHIQIGCWSFNRKDLLLDLDYLWKGVAADNFESTREHLIYITPDMIRHYVLWADIRTLIDALKDYKAGEVE